MRRFTSWDDERQDEANGTVVELHDDTAMGMLLDLEDAIEKHCEEYDQRMVEWPVERVVLARETGTNKPIIRFEVDMESVPQYRASEIRDIAKAIRRKHGITADDEIRREREAVEKRRKIQ